MSLSVNEASLAITMGEEVKISGDESLEHNLTNSLNRQVRRSSISSVDSCISIISTSPSLPTIIEVESSHNRTNNNNKNTNKIVNIDDMSTSNNIKIKKIRKDLQKRKKNTKRRSFPEVEVESSKDAEEYYNRDALDTSFNNVQMLLEKEHSKKKKYIRKERSCENRYYKTLLKNVEEMKEMDCDTNNNDDNTDNDDVHFDIVNNVASWYVDLVSLSTTESPSDKKQDSNEVQQHQNDLKMSSSSNDNSSLNPKSVAATITRAAAVLGNNNYNVIRRRRESVERRFSSSSSTLLLQDDYNDTNLRDSTCSHNDISVLTFNSASCSTPHRGEQDNVFDSSLVSSWSYNMRSQEGDNDEDDYDATSCSSSIFTGASTIASNSHNNYNNTHTSPAAKTLVSHHINVSSSLSRVQQHNNTSICDSTSTNDTTESTTYPASNHNNDNSTKTPSITDIDISNSLHRVKTRHHHPKPSTLLLPPTTTNSCSTSTTSSLISKSTSLLSIHSILELSSSTYNCTTPHYKTNQYVNTLSANHFYLLTSFLLAQEQQHCNLITATLTSTDNSANIITNTKPLQQQQQQHQHQDAIIDITSSLQRIQNTKPITFNHKLLPATIITIPKQEQEQYNSTVTITSQEQNTPHDAPIIISNKITKKIKKNNKSIIIPKIKSKSTFIKYAIIKCCKKNTKKINKFFSPRK